MPSLNTHPLGRPAQEWCIPSEIDLDRIPSETAPDSEDILLVYSLNSGTRVSDKDQRSPKLLAEFVALASAPPEDILAFARTWGVLKLCIHDLPRSHIPSLPFTDTVNPGNLPGLYGPSYPCYIKRGRPKAGVSDPFSLLLDPDTDPASWAQSFEAVAMWRTFAGEAKAILEVTNDLKRGHRPKEPAIRLAGHRIPNCLPPRFTPTIDEIRKIITDVLNEWICMAGILPWVHLDQKRFLMTIGGQHLFAALALQLVSAVCQNRKMIICDECQIPYTPTKRPKPENRHYCPRCRKSGAVSRHTSRVYRQKQTAKRRT